MDELRQNHHPEGSDRDAEDGHRPGPQYLTLADAEHRATMRRRSLRPTKRQDAEILHSEVVDVPPPVDRYHQAKRVPKARECIVLSCEILGRLYERSPAEARRRTDREGGQQE